MEYIVGLWFILFFACIISYLSNKESPYDLIFRHQDYSYDGVLARVLIMEKYLGRELTSAKRALERFKINGMRSRRDFYYYSRYIEPFILELLIAHEGGNWNFYWRKSSVLNKIHFFYILLLPVSIFISFTLLFAEEELMDQYKYALPLIILAILGISSYLIIINVMAYSFVAFILEFINKESGVLNKNITALTAITLSKKFYLNSALIMGVSGYFLSSISKIGAFKGFGGGKFGGGGASGKW